MTGDNPASHEDSERFDELVQGLFWNRLVLQAPVEHGAAAYPDGVWGIPLDTLATPRQGYATPRTSHRLTPRRSTGFSFGPNLRPGEGEGGSEATTPRRPLLPALRLHTQRPTQHTLLADSHYALGGFSDDRPLNWKMRDPERTPRPKRPPWKLETSIWAPRKSGATACDAKDFYDTVLVRQQAFDADWASTTGGKFLEDKEVKSVFGLSKKVVSRDKIEATRDALREAYDQTVPWFTTYSCYMQSHSKLGIFG